MNRLHSLNIWRVIVGSFLIFSYISLFFSATIISPAYAQEKTTAGEHNKLKDILLRPDGWLVEWRGNSSGVIESIFEDQGGNIVVKINNPAWNQKCERNVTIVGDDVKFDGCNDRSIVLKFNPDDKEYPFKGESACCYYKLKAK